MPRRSPSTSRSSRFITTLRAWAPRPGCQWRRLPGFHWLGGRRPLRAPVPHARRLIPTGNISGPRAWITIFNDKDRGYIRVLRDNGFQPTYTSPFGPTFNDQSNQPQMTGQVSETHVFGPNTVNEFKGSALFYAAVFMPSDPSGALAALPTYLTFSGTPFTNVGAWGEPRAFLFPAGPARVPVSNHGRLLACPRKTHLPRRL